jgi:hypothetical protein
MNGYTSLGLTLLLQQKYLEAEQVLSECLKIHEKIHPDEWNTFDVKAMLGRALLRQKKYPEAESELNGGYEGMKQREAKLSPGAKLRLTGTLEDLVQLYDALGRKDEADAWRKKLQSRKATETAIHWIETVVDALKKKPDSPAKK